MCEVFTNNTRTTCAVSILSNTPYNTHSRTQSVIDSIKQIVRHACAEHVSLRVNIVWLNTRVHATQQRLLIQYSISDYNCTIIWERALQPIWVLNVTTRGHPNVHSDIWFAQVISHSQHTHGVIWYLAFCAPFCPFRLTLFVFLDSFAGPPSIGDFCLPFTPNRNFILSSKCSNWTRDNKIQQRQRVD